MSIIDMHVHTEFSPCSKLKLVEALEKASRIGVGLVITDHDTIKGALKAKSLSWKYEVAVFIGCEISTKDGQVLAYGIEEEIPPRLPAEQTIELIREQGGAAVAPHPFCSARESLFEKTYTLPLDGIEVLNLTEGGISEEARSVALSRGLAQTGGSDAHTLNLVGEAGTRFPYQPESEDDLVELLRKKKCTPVKLTHRF